MLLEDLKVCSERHTTSKIATYDDISSINAYGFRGEALASIASLSEKLEIVSRTEEGSGYIVRYDNFGYAINDSINIIPAKKGTKVTCYNLFHNVPVRRTFQKEEKKKYLQNYAHFV